VGWLCATEKRSIALVEEQGAQRENTIEIRSTQVNSKYRGW
jgi:hypothetical protein